MNVKYFRLTSGEDIISNVVDETLEKIELDHPMTILIKFDPKTGNQLMIIDNWIPKSLVKRQMVTISQKDIVFVTDPSVEFEKYYLASMATVKMLESLPKADKIQDEIDPEYAEIMLSDVDPTNKIIH